MAASAPSRNMAVPLTAFAAGAVVALLVGVFGKVHDPTLAGTTTLGFHTVIDMKVVLIVIVAYHCLWALGLESGALADGEPVPTRTVVHGLLGCAVIGALVVKVTAVRSRRAPGWFLPVAGGLLFALLVGVVLTSAVWYLAAKG